MPTKRLEAAFLALIIAALAFLGWNWYAGYRFDHNPVSEKIQERIEMKKAELMLLTRKAYSIHFDVPVVVSDRLPSRLYGMASYAPEGTITIVLNKKRMKESLEYVIDDVMPHEYAHALMFALGYFQEENGGHTKAWQEACLKLGGQKCDRFVNHNDVLMGKLLF